MTLEELNKTTQQNYAGLWSANETNIGNVKLEIIEDHSYNIFKLTINDKTEEFNSQLHWFGNLLVLIDKPEYIIRFADKVNLVFGKNSGKDVFDDIIWEIKLERKR